MGLIVVPRRMKNDVSFKDVIDGEKKKVLGKIDNKPSSKSYRLFQMTVTIVNMHPQKPWRKNCVRCNGNVSSSRASSANVFD